MQRLMLTVVLLNVCCTLYLAAQQLTCTPAVSPAMCKRFDEAFGQMTMWPMANVTKNVDIVVVDSAQFKTEQGKVDAAIETARKNMKTVGDINRATGQVAGRGVFEHLIVECPSGGLVKKIVISTEAVSGSQTAANLSEDLLFYVIGYDQGLTQGLADAVQ